MLFSCNPDLIWFWSTQHAILVDWLTYVLRRWATRDHSEGPCDQVDKVSELFPQQERDEEAEDTKSLVLVWFLGKPGPTFLGLVSKEAIFFRCSAD